MAPKRDYGPATRRSSRLASQTNSRASSVSQDTTSAGVRKGKSRPRTRADEPTAGFDAIAAHDRIVHRDDRDYIKKLTSPEKGAVISVFADREVDLLGRIRELEAERAELARERDEALQKFEEKRILRDLFLRERLSQASEQREEQVAAAVASSARVLSADDAVRQGIMDVEPSMSIDVAGASVASDSSELVVDSSLFEGTPEPTPSNAPSALLVAPSTPAPASLMRRMFNTLASPFARTTPSIASSQSGGSPLPASRKRSAPEPVHDLQARAQVEHSSPAHVPRAPRPETPRQHRFTGPSSMHPDRPTSLETITEYTEPSLRAPDSTPSRPAMQTPARHRPIKAVRQRQQAAANLNTPIRSWTEPRRPREPNADLRLEKLRRYQDIQDELKSLKHDSDLKDVVKTRVKRVKVDDLTFIPHNRPGDSTGTFRVPEIDSDDEMEVDDTSELRSNIFAVAQGEEDRQAAAVQESLRKTSTQASPAKATLETTPTLPANIPDGRVSSIFKQAFPQIQAPNPSVIEEAVEEVEEADEEEDDDDDDVEIFQWPSVGERRPDQESEEVPDNEHSQFLHALDIWRVRHEVRPIYTNMWPDLEG